MSDDLAQALLCLSFTVPAAGLVVLVFFRKNLRGGSDVESSSAILEEEDPVDEAPKLSRGRRTAVAVSIAVCLGLISLVTAITLLAAGTGSAAASKCPLGF
jgi:hypothetical protein